MGLEALIGLPAEYEDAALYHQMLYLVGHGELFVNTIHPLHRPSHLPLVLVPLWPLYALLGGGARAVFWLQAFAVALGAWPVAKLARTKWAGAAFLLAAPTWVIATSTFRPLVFALTPVLWALWAFDARRGRAFAVALVAALVCREDLALTLIVFAPLAAWRGYPRAWIAGTTALCVGWFVVATRVVLPSILPADYGAIVFESNWSLSGLADPTHWGAAVALLVSWAALPLLRLEIGLAWVTGAAVMLHKSGFAANLIHLLAPGWAALSGAAALALAHLSPSRRKRALVAVALGIGVVWATPLRHVALEREANGPVRNPDPTPPPCAHSEIPADARVTASGHCLPIYAARRVLYEYGHRDTPFADVDWIVLDTTDMYAGAGDYVRVPPDDLERHVSALTQGGFESVRRWESGGLFRRVRADPRLTSRLRAMMPRRDAPGAMRRGVRSPGEDLRPPQKP